jgi:alpha-beta hydrolase superfamily lysophospholipase
VTEATDVLTLPAAGNHRIPITVCKAPDEPWVVMHILHGLGEYAGRYARFAEAAARRGIATVGHDHRGHGAAAPTRGWFAATDGWDLVIEDALTVQEWIADRYPKLPRVVLGHSMGSYIAQDLAMRRGGELAALILSGSTWYSRVRTLSGKLLATAECHRLGDRAISPLLERLGFAAFNRRISPARTDSDWLSRDAAEVDKYVADPLTGGPFTAGLWRDLTEGLLRISSDSALRRIPASLPILITGGAEDPVGGDDGMGNLVMHYAQTGHTRLTVKIYPGARHEMLNETNRDEVTADWLDWVAETLHR